MIVFGTTSEQYEQDRISLLKRLRSCSMVFTLLALLPIAIYWLFAFGLIPSRSPFAEDIQEPVAKLQTNSTVGTAFLVSPTKLLTARHVVEHLKVGDEVQLFFEKTPTPKNITAKIIYIAPTTIPKNTDGTVPMEYFLSDFAVLEVPETTDIVPLYLGESDVVAELDEVILIGYPSGDYSISKGNINNSKFQGFDLFKLDATSNPGNSGGPCISKVDNSVIGILVGGSGPNYQGENVALKITNVKTLLKTAKIDVE